MVAISNGSSYGAVENLARFNIETIYVVYGTVPFSMGGIVTLTSTTTLYLFVELEFTNYSTAGSWQATNFNAGYIKIAR